MPENIIHLFLDNPVEIYNQTEKFKRKIDRIIEEEARNIESGLENSIMPSFDQYSFLYYTRRIDSEGPEALIADALLREAIGNGAAFGIRQKITVQISMQKASGNDKAVEVLEKVNKYVTREPEKAYNKYIDDGSGGTHYSGSKTIRMKKIPKDVVEGLNTPRFLRPLVNSTIRSRTSFEKTLTHELTHAYLNLNSKNYGSNDVKGAINEVSAHYISYVVCGYQFTNEDSELYDRPDLIKWGVQLMIDKAEEFRDRGSKSIGVDFGRNIMLKIYINSVNSRGSDFKILLKACLLKEDKRRLQEFRKLDESIESNISQIRHMLFGDAQGTLQGRQGGQRLQELAEEINWENPEKMEKQILQEIYRKAIDEEEFGGLEWVNYQITEELQKRRKMLEKYLEAFEVAKNNLSDSEFLEDIERSEKMIIRMEEKLSDIIERGELPEANLKHSPAKLMD